MAAIRVTVGDVAKVPAQAVLATVNPYGLWGGLHYELGRRDCDFVAPGVPGIDGALLRAGGPQFHRQALGLLQARQGATLLAQALTPHAGAFEHVLFVCDDGRTGTLRELAEEALQAAAGLALRRVALGLWRAGRVQASPLDCMRELCEAARSPAARGLDEITFVTPHPRLAGAWEAILARRPPRLLASPPPARDGLLEVVEGSLAEVAADALLASVHPQGPSGYLHDSLRDLAGEQFAEGARWLRGRAAGTTAVVPACEPHEAPFDTVVWVVDDQSASLEELVVAGLVTAGRAGLATVSVPTLRLGRMGGRADDSAKLAQLVAGAERALRARVGLRRVRLLVWDKPARAEALRQLMRAARGVWVSHPPVPGVEEVVGVSADGRRLLFSPEPGVVELRDREGGETLQRLSLRWNTGARLDQACLDASGQRALLCVRFQSPELWDLETGKSLFSLPPLRQPPMPVGCKALAFSPDGGLVAAGFYFRQVGVWEAQTGEIRHFVELPGPESEVDGYATLITRLEFRAGQLFAASEDAQAGLLDLTTGTLQVLPASALRLEGPPPAPPEPPPRPEALRDLKLAGEAASFTVTSGRLALTSRCRPPWAETTLWRLDGDRCQPLWKSGEELCPHYPVVLLEDGSAAFLTSRGGARLKVRGSAGQLRIDRPVATRGRRLAGPARFYWASDEAGGEQLICLETGASLWGARYHWLLATPVGPQPLQNLIHGARRAYRFRELSPDRQHLVVEEEGETLLLRTRGDGWEELARLPFGETPCALSFPRADQVVVITLEGAVYSWRA